MVKEIKIKCQHQLFDDFLKENKNLLIMKKNTKFQEHYSDEGNIYISKSKKSFDIVLYKTFIRKNWMGKEVEKIESTLLGPRNLFMDKTFIIKSKNEELLLEQLKKINKKYKKLLKEYKPTTKKDITIEIGFEKKYNSIRKLILSELFENGKPYSSSFEHKLAAKIFKKSQFSVKLYNGIDKSTGYTMEVNYISSTHNIYLNIFGDTSSIYKYSSCEFELNTFIKRLAKNKINTQPVLLFFSELIKYYKEQTILKENEFQLMRKSIDGDNDGRIDIVNYSKDLKKLLTKNQKIIIEVNKEYLHKIIKLINFLNNKYCNLEFLYDKINDSNSINEYVDLIKILKNSLNNYKSLSMHSFNLIISLKDNNLVVFFEIYEFFEKLNIFNSKWENDISNKLDDVNNNLVELIYSIHNMERNIVAEINYLTYTTEESFKSLNESLSNELQSINSSIDVSNLLSAISTYQLYKINEQN